MDVIVEFDAVDGETSSVRWPHAVSFQLPRGGAHVIRTRSAFSAPLLRLCLGFSEPKNGHVTVHGKHPSALNRFEVRELRRQLGCTLDPDGLVANMSVRMNLIVPLVFATGLTLPQANERVESVLDLMRLEVWADMRPATLPAEVRQSVALARALCPQPSLLLLENPLASVDQRETRRLMSFCRVQAETMLIATHRKDDILHEFADAVWELDEDGFRRAA
jgi:ABC-type methionine transport system ATPase subunit